MPDTQIINPIDYPGWDDLLLTNENYSFFHTSAWARVLCESYGYEPFYFTSIENGKLSALIPVMEVNSFLTGRKGVSLPFTDFCQPIFSDGVQFKEMTSQVIEYGRKAGWKYIALRGNGGYFLNANPSSLYFGHILNLACNNKNILASFRKSTQRNIRKAIKEGLQFEICNSLGSVKAFYRLNCITRKRHGLPPQPFFFFKNIFEHVISKQLGIVILAFYQAKPIAGAVFLHAGEKAYFKYGASDTAYHRYRPNYLVLWKAIEFYAENGFRSMDFGRTGYANEGLLQFKRGWGISEQTIKYYKYHIAKNAYLQENFSVNMFSNLFKRTPIPLLNLVGFLFYRHAG